MKNPVDCKLKDITNTDQITYEDYLLYKEIDGNKRHPIFRASTYASLVSLALTLPFIIAGAITGFWIHMFISFFATFGVITGTYAIVNSIPEGLDKYNKNLRKRYKALKQAKAWKRISNLMKAYVISDKFQQDKLAHEKAELEQSHLDYEAETMQAIEYNIAERKKLEERLSIIKKMIAKDKGLEQTSMFDDPKNEVSPEEIVDEYDGQHINL